ncbi:MAG: TrmH family RNA methyltransferase [Bacteroidales bacterium]
MLPEILSSHRNPKIQDLKLISEKSKYRRERGVFIAEGKKEVERALKSGYQIVELYICPEIFSAELANSEDDIRNLISDKNQYFITKELYSKIAYREGTEGIIALFKTRELSLESIKLSKTPLIIILESVEKPGNLGAVIRTADAVNADAVIVCDPLTDLFNPNIIRSSIGGIFSVQVCTATSEETYKWLDNNNITIFTAQLQNASFYHEQDMRSGMAIVMGTESTGLSDFWRERAHKKIKIPMMGLLDSLNVSVSTAVICYEALRQRNFKK